MPIPEPGFEELLKEAATFHGHACTGQVLGVRMAMRGLREVGIRDPKGADKKKLIVFVEIDRCATDAVVTVTGCRVGKRSVKTKDYGKMAATFVNLESGRSARVLVRPDANEKVGRYSSASDEYGASFEAFQKMPDEDLLAVQEVVVHIAPQDLPGKPLRKVSCEDCGESVMDMREVQVGGRTLCRPCAEGSCYYTRVLNACGGDAPGLDDLSAGGER